MYLGRDRRVALLADDDHVVDDDDLKLQHQSPIWRRSDWRLCNWILLAIECIFPASARLIFFAAFVIQFIEFYLMTKFRVQLNVIHSETVSMKSPYQSTQSSGDVS